MHIDTQQSRRTFLRRASQLGILGAAAPFASSLGLMSETAAAAASDYKALVCVFLYGGNDNWNTLPPYDADSYNAYLRARPSVALRHSDLAATVLEPINSLGGRQFALNPALGKLMPIFRQGKLWPVLNVGALVEPTTRKAYFANSVRLPPKLFSHNDQQSHVQSFHPEGSDAGWGGRMGDIIQSGNGSSALTCVSLQGRSLWLSGNSATPYSVSPEVVSELLWGADRLYGSGAAYDAMRRLITDQNHPSWIAQDHARVVDRSLKLSDTLSAALAQIPAKKLPMFDKRSSLAQQLKMVARLMAVGPSLGLKRQVFFVSLGGFDTHNGLSQNHPALLRTLGDGLAQFYAASVQLGMSESVTAFTTSDFGRTLSDNGDGSDHGWGGVQFAMGGAVTGRTIYGTPPTVGIDTNDDVGAGRLIPTISWEMFAAALGLWFGLPKDQIPVILPNLLNFDISPWSIN